MPYAELRLLYCIECFWPSLNSKKKIVSCFSFYWKGGQEVPPLEEAAGKAIIRLQQHFGRLIPMIRSLFPHLEPPTWSLRCKNKATPHGNAARYSASALLITLWWWWLISGRKQATFSFKGGGSLIDHWFARCYINDAIQSSFWEAEVAHNCP